MSEGHIGEVRRINDEVRRCRAADCIEELWPVIGMHNGGPARCRGIDQFAMQVRQQGQYDHALGG